MTKMPDDCMPSCEGCCASDFDPENDIGDCHLLPMDWVTVEGEPEPIPMWKPAVRNGWCRHYQRKVN